METKKPFLTWVFCESDGTPSFARFSTGILLAFVLGWDSANLVLAWQWNTHHLAAGQLPLALLPDAMVLAAQAAFITVLYGTNKFATAFTKA